MFRIVLCLMCVLAIAGCGDTKPPEKQQTVETPTAPTPAPTNNPRASQQIVAPPAGAQWTIYCLEVGGPGHVDQMNQLKSQLIQQTKMPAWYVLHEQERSTLYYGYYRDRAGADVQHDRKAVASFRDARGDAPFNNAVVVPLDSPDPTSPPEWNLVNSKGYWSIQIAAFMENMLRKEAALEAVRELRGQGIDAYYYHGPSVSSVCVGSWPEEALRRQDKDAAETIDPTQPLMVINGGLPPGMQKRLQSNARDKDGNPIRVFVQSVEIVDANMLAMFKQFPVHRLNYDEEFQTYRDPQTGKVNNTPKPCVIVPIPRTVDTAPRDTGAPGQPNLLNPNRSNQQGGRLRSIGE